MTFIEVVLASILGQLILAAILGIIKGITSVVRDERRRKANETAKELLNSLTDLQNALAYIKKKTNENPKKHTRTNYADFTKEKEEQKDE